MDDAVVFFASGGGESVETAVKLVRRYWSLVGRDEKTIVISRERAYHGLAGYGTSLVGMDVFTVGVGPLAGDMLQVPWNDASALASAIDAVGPERVAAFFCEPIVGAGGVLLPPPGYLEEALRVCRERGRPLRRGRGHLRLLPRRRLVREHAIRARPGSRHVREGRHLRVPPAGRRHRRRARPRAVLDGRRRRLAPRLHVLGACDGDGGRPREPRHHGTRGARHARPRAGDGARGRARAARLAWARRRGSRRARRRRGGAALGRRARGRSCDRGSRPRRRERARNPRSRTRGWKPADLACPDDRRAPAWRSLSAASAPRSTTSPARPSAGPPLWLAAAPAAAREPGRRRPRPGTRRPGPSGRSA